MRDVDKSRTQVLAESLEFSAALSRRSRWPTFQTQKNETDRGCNAESNDCERNWPREAVRFCRVQHWTFDVERFFSGAIEQEHDHEQEQEEIRMMLWHKKITAPHAR